MSIDIPQDLFDTYYSVVDDMIDLHFGVSCTLYYPPIKEICSNCVYNPVTGASSNKYKTGGPYPFEGGLCPYCDGNGYEESTQTESIMLRCYFDRKSWAKMGVDYKLADGSCVVYGHMRDISKLQKANEITLNDQNAGNGVFRYRLAGEPTPHGFKKTKYFIAAMERLK